MSFCRKIHVTITEDGSKAYSRWIIVRKELGKLKEGMDGIHVVTLIISLGFSINFVYLNVDLYIDDYMCTISEVANQF
jgi:hypothetical protein